jgi:hypothetical protein
VATSFRFCEVFGQHICLFELSMYTGHSQTEHHGIVNVRKKNEGQREANREFGFFFKIYNKSISGRQKKPDLWESGTLLPENF